MRIGWIACGIISIAAGLYLSTYITIQAYIFYDLPGLNNFVRPAENAKPLTKWGKTVYLNPERETEKQARKRLNRKVRLAAQASSVRFIGGLGAIGCGLFVCMSVFGERKQ